MAKNNKKNFGKKWKREEEDLCVHSIRYVDSIKLYTNTFHFV